MCLRSLLSSSIELGRSPARRRLPHRVRNRQERRAAAQASQAAGALSLRRHCQQPPALAAARNHRRARVLLRILWLSDGYVSAEAVSASVKSAVCSGRNLSPHLIGTRRPFSMPHPQVLIPLRNDLTKNEGAISPLIREEASMPWSALALLRPARSCSVVAGPRITASITLCSLPFLPSSGGPRRRQEMAGRPGGSHAGAGRGAADARCGGDPREGFGAPALMMRPEADWPEGC